MKRRILAVSLALMMVLSSVTIAFADNSYHYADPKEEFDSIGNSEEWVRVCDFEDGIRSITWGSWTSNTITFHAAGMTAAAVVAYLASAFAFVPFATPFCDHNVVLIC